MRISYKIPSGSHQIASIGVGSLIIFIAMILIAGVTASVLMQTMNTLQEQAMQTGTETIREIATGVKVTHISGYSNGTKITALAIFIQPLPGSEDIDLSQSYIRISDSTKAVILRYDQSCFNTSLSLGLFGSLNLSNLDSSEFGVLVVRDLDNSCTAQTPVVNTDDLLVLMVNTTSCFTGIGTRTDVTGTVHAEYGIKGVISFMTPNTLIDTILDLQP